jgi:hypothetical protein
VTHLGNRRVVPEADQLASRGVADTHGRLASNVRRLAPAYFVQTPYFWFPIEPHFRFPFFHRLPESWRYRLIMMRDLGYIRKASSVSDAVRRVQSAILLDQGCGHTM